MEALSQAYRALGDATRLRILRLVAQTPLNVSEIVSLVGIAQPTVSHHLGKLKAMRLLLEERQGVFTYYSLDLHPDDPRWPLIRWCARAPWWSGVSRAAGGWPPM